MNHVLIVRELICGDIAGRSIDELRDAVYERCAGKLDRRGLIDDAGRLGLTVQSPDVFIGLLGIVDLADALGDEGDALLGLGGNNGAHARCIARLNDHAQRFGLEVLLVDAGDALLSL